MFSGQAPLEGGEIEKPTACMQKPRSKNWPNGRCALGKPELATGNGDCSRKPKAFRSEMAARWILEAIDCEVCQAVRINAFLAGLVYFVFSHVSWRQILCRRRFLA